jgi:hypothetical protein
METTSIYDFLHLLSLIRIKPNMDFGGDLAFVHICHNTFFFPSFFLSKRVEKGSQTKTKVRGKKQTVASIHFIFFILFFQIRA